MADTVTTTTRPLTRAQIADIVGRNPRAIKLLEDLIQDVSQTIPTAVDEVMYSALFSLHGADGSKEASERAQQMATELQALQAACSRAASDLSVMRKELDLLREEINDARSRLMSAISASQAQASQALTLSIGV